MPRRRVSGAGDLVFHVMNRGASRRQIFDGSRAYADFVSLLVEGRCRIPVRLLTFCLMPTHFHLVIWPREDRQVSRFMHWVSGTHALRWNAERGNIGRGAVYQGRYKAVAVQTERHLLRVCRYVERNPVRAGLVPGAEGWRWGGLRQRELPIPDVSLDGWPETRPDGWSDLVNSPDNPRELLAIRESIARNRPIGDPGWRQMTAGLLGVSLRGPGRPRKLPSLAGHSAGQEAREDGGAVDEPEGVKN